MLHFLPAPLRGLIAGLLLALNTLFWCWPLFIVALLKLLLPFAPIQRALRFVMHGIAESWIGVNKFWMRLVGTIEWNVQGLERFDTRHSYLVTSNHQSWVDILVLQYLLNRRMPLLKFFLKQELIWVPFLGLAFWALDYPFMKRYSRAFLEKNPHMKGKDLEITKAACEKFKRLPVTVVNYLEGTRFTPAKQAQQQSPYRYLLKPKAGGVAFVLAALGEQLDAVLDVTLVYPDQQVPGFWDLLSGQVAKVIVDIRTLPLDPTLCRGDYENDPAFRQQMQDWVSALWQAKDARIADLRHDAQP